MKIKKNERKGITLIALVITVIILLILATISIQSLTNTGLFKRAQEAKNAMENAETEQALILNEYENALNSYYVPESKPKSNLVEDNTNKVLSTTENTELKDEYGNKIVVPAGFKIVSDSTTNNATTVDKGITIEDATKTEEGTETPTNGSQFVWIPVGTIYKDAEHSGAQKKTIELNRYTFDTYGNPTAQYEKSIYEYETNFQELSSSDKGNIVAKSISDFKTSVTTNGGYYVGRYEARTATPRNTEEDTLTQITEKGTENVYNFVTQSQAANQAKNMYISAKFTSDLMNSYAWDTAVLYLQTYGTKPIYSKQISINSEFSITGTNLNTNKDIQCNVYDIASNLYEWTTETCEKEGYPGVFRGGYYGEINNGSSYRDGYGFISRSNIYLGFRTILYINN